MNNEKILSDSELLDITAGANFLPKDTISIPKNPMAVAYYGLRRTDNSFPGKGVDDVVALYSVEPTLDFE